MTSRGKALRDILPRGGLGDWKPEASRPDPIELLIASSRGRAPTLLPIRYGRMLSSPFAFYRGAAAIMAQDLSHMPVTGVPVQACGDCHLVNFGGFATAERRLIFDINDFDETTSAPWEWDLQRLAASFVIAGRHNGFADADAGACAQRCAESYRKRIAEFATMRVLDEWYARIDLEPLIAAIEDKDARRGSRNRLEKAAHRNVLDEDFPQLVSMDQNEPKIRDNPPLIYHLSDQHSVAFEAAARKAFDAYRQSLPDDRRVLLDRFAPMDFAMKVVGVGSVGTHCGILLMMAGKNDPLFLQVKEARPSVLEAYAGRSAYRNRGQRVVVGQRIMQAASDIFLGWTAGSEGRHYYIRQLRDMKIKPRVELYDLRFMLGYADVCGWALARAHARSGSAAIIAGYLGASDKFDHALANFATAYADQNESDHAQLAKAVRSGRLEAHDES